MPIPEDLILSLILFFPLLSAIVIGLLPNEQKQAIRWAALILSIVPFIVSMLAWLAYDPSLGGYQFEIQQRWYPAINSSFHLGVDGISLPLIVLTTFLTPLSILASFGIENKVKSFMMLFLMLETGILGVFMSLDLLLFFLFYEIGLVPMYFLIFEWGSKNRRYASFKFMIYTIAASLGMLLAIQLIGITVGTFDIVAITEQWPAFTGTVLGGAVDIGVIKGIAFWLFAIAFGLKVPIWPLHTWLPDAHSEAPTAGSMILAGVLLKLGAYGFLRLVLPFFPEQAQAAAGVIAFLAMMAIVMGAYAAYGQQDFKRLVAYSSVNHMGFVMLGIAAVAYLSGSSSPELQQTAAIAGTGAVLQMVNHGLSAAGMFFLVGVVYERTHTRDLREIGGGIWQLAPIYGGIMIFTRHQSLGLPGLNGFVGEFAIVRGAWPVFSLLVALSMIGLLMTGAYILKGILHVLHGPENHHWAEHGNMEISLREVFVIAPLMVPMLVIGLYPLWVTDMINQTIQRFVG